MYPSVHFQRQLPLPRDKFNSDRSCLRRLSWGTLLWEILILLVHDPASWVIAGLLAVSKGAFCCPVSQLNGLLGALRPPGSLPLSGPPSEPSASAHWRAQPLARRLAPGKRLTSWPSAPFPLDGVRRRKGRRQALEPSRARAGGLGCGRSRGGPWEVLPSRRELSLALPGPGSWLGRAPCRCYSGGQVGPRRWLPGQGSCGGLRDGAERFEAGLRSLDIPCKALGKESPL